MADDKISEEDKALFRQAMQAVKPLKTSKRVVLSKDLPPPVVVKKLEPAQTVSHQDLYLSDYYSEPVAAESILSFHHSGFPGKRMRELRQGLVYWQARLDLHGLKPEGAKGRLVEFIALQYSLNQRCLLVIHGKGGQSGGFPVLKNLVNHWLKQIPQVLAFHSALPKDGGSGALYVLLKRQR